MVLYQQRQSTMAVLLLLSLTVVVHSKNVLFFPLPFFSHMASHLQLAQETVSYGHNTAIALMPYIATKFNFTTVTPIIYTSHDVNILEICRKRPFPHDATPCQHKDNFCLRDIHTMWGKLLKDEEFYLRLKSLKLDLIVLDSVAHLEIMTLLAYRLGVPHAFLGVYMEYFTSRIPQIPSFVPNVLSTLSDKMTFKERVINTVQTISVYLCLEIYNPLWDLSIVKAMESKLNGPLITKEELLGRTEIFLFETEELLDYPKPSLPNVKFLGSMTVGPAQSLSAEYQQIMDSATDGVILVSFGSLSTNPPRPILKKLLLAFSQLKYTVLWKINITSNLPSNIKAANWLPQNGLLAHVNTKVFVTHCGLHGKYEALYHGVPMVSMPIHSDQPGNAFKIKNKGYGHVLNFWTSTADEIVETITEVAVNPKYRLAIEKASEIFKSRPLPRVQAAFWLDHVLKYGGSYMGSGGQTMPLYQFFLVDVISFLLLICVMTLLLLWLVFRVLVYFCIQKVKQD